MTVMPKNTTKSATTGYQTDSNLIEEGVNKDSTKTTHSAKTLPTHLNLDRWEEVGYQWSGQIVPQDLQRLVDTVPKGYQDNAIELSFELKQQGQLLTLLMDFTGEVWVTCQRCLQPMPIDISHDAQLILLQSEEQESLVDDADDYVLLEELIENNSAKDAHYSAEIDKGNRLLPVKKLVEDELLLDIPLSAKHDDCEMAVEQVGEIIEEETENPFAVLESLKGKL